MNLILNRDFKMPDDGWYQLAPLGEFPHAVAGVIQIVDAESCVAMVARFKADAAVPNFAGLLVDFDHFSLDDRARSEAAGWIMDLSSRETGLWANIRWSDVGEEAVKGGRYRFLSPVWARSDCVDLGNGRVRPVRLLNAAVTNDPNLKGLVPLANASTALSAGAPVDRRASIEGAVEEPACARNTEATARRSAEGGSERMMMKRVIEKLMNHLGLPGDASEDVVLEKMQGLPAVTAVADLQNSLRVVEAERDTLKATVKTVEGELLNRDLAEFEGVISDGTKAFWSEQLISNRAGALAALGDLVAQRDAVTRGGEGGNGKGGEARKPLHNRATARPVIPGVGTPAGETESKAVKIRNRAHEIAKGEKVPFSVAFRRAEREVLGNG